MQIKISDNELTIMWRGHAEVFCLLIYNLLIGNQGVTKNSLIGIIGQNNLSPFTSFISILLYLELYYYYLKQIHSDLRVVIQQAHQNLHAPT